MTPISATLSFPSRILLGSALSLLAACATTPFPSSATQQVDKTLQPAQATAAPDATRGRQVMWGGKIIDSHNLSGSTTLTILSYPLDREGRPDLDKNAQGRFIAIQNGFLETADYAPQRLVTLVGTLDGVRQGQVGQAAYVYPLVQVRALHLWPQDRIRRGRYPPVQFGIGVGVGL